MDLFCFASKNLENIKRGIENRMWAVSTLLNQQTMRSRTTKAGRYLYPGACGLLYCNPLHGFTTPFIVKSFADPERIVTEVWPEPWCLPFEIEPLGTWSRVISAEDAKEQWPIVQSRMTSNYGKGGISAAMNLTGTTVFVPVKITDTDWERILESLQT